MTSTTSDGPRCPCCGSIIAFSAAAEKRISLMLNLPNQWVPHKCNWPTEKPR